MARDKNYPGSIDRRSGSFRVRLSVNGERHAFTLKDADREEAEAFARQKFDELRSRARRTGTTRSPALSALMRRFEEEEVPQLAESSQRAYGYALSAARQYFVKGDDDPPLDEIRAADVRGFLNWRRMHSPQGEKRKEPLAAVTIKRTRSILHRIFSYADRLEMRDGNPVSRVEPPKVEERNPIILSDEQYAALLTAAEARDDMLHTYVLLLGETGLRALSEALWLRWGDLDLEEGFLHVVSGRDGHRVKSGKDRHVPLTPRIRQRLSDHAARYRLQMYNGERTPWVFHIRRRYKDNPAGSRRRTFQHALQKASEKAGLPDRWRPHDLRHRRVTTWLAEGHSPALVQEAMGHADLSTTMSYKHLAREHLRALVETDTPKEELADLTG